MKMLFAPGLFKPRLFRPKEFEGGSPSGVFLPISWIGVTNIGLTWIGVTNIGLTWIGVTNIGLTWIGGSGMIQYRIPIRNNTPQPLVYTFKDQNQNIIDLTNYVSASVEIKQGGQVLATLAASFVTPKTGGQVKYLPAYTFIGLGPWSVQFFVQDGSGNRVFGDILLITVVPNVEDLGLTQNPTY